MCESTQVHLYQKVLMQLFSTMFAIVCLQPGGKMVKGYCVRINTGAPVPEGADAVVQVEDTLLLHSADEGRRELEIKIMKAPTPGQDIRYVII